MKKIHRILATATLAGAVFTSISPSAEAASLDPILTQLASAFPFTDVPIERREMISALYQNKFFNGVSADKFGWDLSIKRVDAAMIVARGMGYRKGDSVPELLTFKDIPDRAKDAVSYLQDFAVIFGKTEPFFGSNDMITRGEAAIILLRAYYDVLPSSPKEPLHHFKDATGRYAAAINRLAAAGIVNGKTPNRFGTNDPVKRGEFVMMIARLSDPALSLSSYGDLPSSQGGLTIKAEKESYRLLSDTPVSITIVNTADFGYGSSREYKLEKKQGDKWLQIKYANGVYFPGDFPVIEAGDSQKVNISFGSFKTLMTAGEYRVIQKFSPLRNEEEKDPVSIAAYFTITE